jgi:Zn-dependent protease with chaperone function
MPIFLRRRKGPTLKNLAAALPDEAVRSTFSFDGELETEFRLKGTLMILRPVLSASLLVFVLCFSRASAWGQEVPGPGAKPAAAMPSVVQVPSEAQPSDHFDAVAATNAYLAQIPNDARSRSDAYFEGGYWLILWDFLYGAIVYILLLQLRWSAAMRNVAERITRFKPLQTLIYWSEFLAVTTILGFPLTVYEGYIRERQYGLATQTFRPWLGDQLKGLLVGIVLGGIITMFLFGVVRRLPRTWWIWGSIVTTLFLAFTVLIFPVYISPIFNKSTPLDDPRITRPVLSMAHANGIAAEKVYQIDASRQTTRMSANVSGLGPTMRITLNDNLLRRGSPEEIQFIMGHEMGHYVLHHGPKGMIFFFVVIVAAFGFLRWSLDWSLARWGERWQIRGITDTAVLPLVFLIGSFFFFVLTPVLNTYTRTDEYEADMYGLNASRQPDGAAQAAIHLGEYRKMNPSPVEEWVFFDHPSGRNRIYAAMRWKAENLKLFTPPPGQ